MSWEEFGDAPKKLRNLIETRGEDPQQLKGYLSFLEKKARSADIDSLTGLNSGQYMEEKLIYEFQRMESNGRRKAKNKTSLPLSLASMDLDKFKQVNDTKGHPEGDYVLSTSAVHFLEALGDAFGSLRKSDAVGRKGGDEIEIILPETELIYATIALNRIKDRIQRQTDLHDVTLSAGIASSDIVGVPLGLNDAGISLLKRYFEHEGDRKRGNLEKYIKKFAGKTETRPSDVISMLDSFYRFLKMSDKNPDMLQSDKYKILSDMMRKYADKALYHAKNEEGKNMVSCYGRNDIFL